MNPLKKQWNKGRRASLKHYEGKINRKAEQFNRIFPLPSYFGPMMGIHSEVLIADLGAGMFSTTGSTWPGVTVRVFPSDALANEYNEILKKHKITPVIPVEYQDMTDIKCQENVFDIVHCANALDHCHDPAKALREMFRICKRLGWIYLRHFSNVAEDQKYKGLHMWNISRTDYGDCLFRSKTDSFLLSSFFPSVVTVVKKEMPYDADNMVVSIFHKV